MASGTEQVLALGELMGQRGRCPQFKDSTPTLMPIKGSFQMLKAVTKATGRLERGVMMGLCQPEGQEVRCGEGTSWFQRAGARSCWAGAGYKPEGPLRVSGRTVAGSDLGH